MFGGIITYNENVGEIMYIKRNIYAKMLDWKRNNFNLALRISGAKQVGKTYIIKKFAEENFDKVIYINMADISGQRFIGCIDDVIACKNGIKATDNPVYDALKEYDFEFIDSPETVIVIDEIQESSKVYNLIRNLARDLSSGVIITGSYLGYTLKREFFYPAGDIHCLELETVSFEEFLDVLGKRELYESVDLFGSSEYGIYDELKSLFDDYMVTGGYPDVVKAYLSGKRGLELRQVCNNVMNLFLSESKAYVSDINDQNALNNILLPIARNMVKEKKGSNDLVVQLQKIMSSDTNKISKKSINNTIAWLVESGVIGLCDKSVECDILNIVSNARFYFRDLGVAYNLLVQTGIDKGTIMGILAETFVYRYLYNLARELRIASDNPIFGVYKDGEIDFLVRNLDTYATIGIEVKYGSNIARTGNILLKDEKIDKLYILKRDTYGGIEENKLTIPLYLCGRLKIDGVE